VNDRGVYYVAKTCFSENGNNDVGPGYIFEASASSPSWHRGTRDLVDWNGNTGAQLGSAPVEDPRNGGWLKFGFHEARAYQVEPGVQNDPNWKYWIKDVSNGNCLRHYAPYYNQQPNYGAGVSRSWVSEAPFIDSAGAAEFGIAMRLNDGLADVVEVEYRYKIDSTKVHVVTRVAELCPNGGGCNGNTVYVKEPKFVVSDANNAYPYNMLYTLNSSGAYACNSPYAIYGSSDPTQRTVQCGDTNAAPDRRTAWFKYGTFTQNPQTENCTNRCTLVLAMAASSGTPATTTYRWYGGPDTAWYGLDEWARRSKARAAFGSASEVVPGFTGHSANCSNGTDAFRRWEVWRWSAPPSGPVSDQVGFHGWEGGSGPQDCLNLFRAMGPSGETFYNYFELSFQ
jgi:hypothetical protein